MKLVRREDVPEKENIIKGRFILAINDEGTNRELWKARFIGQGHQDQFKNELVHNIHVVRHQTTKLLIGLAAVFGFRIFSTHVTQAYLQSAESLRRDIFIDPPKEFELCSDELIKLLNPLYGLYESGDYWGRTYRSPLEEDLDMKACIFDELTKVKKESFFLDTLRTSTLSHPVEQWIIRDNIYTNQRAHSSTLYSWWTTWRTAQTMNIS